MWKVLWITFLFLLLAFCHFYYGKLYLRQVNSSDNYKNSCIPKATLEILYPHAVNNFVDNLISDIVWG